MSSRDIAEHFNLSPPTVAKRCNREAWKRERDQIEQNRATVVSRVSQAVVDKVSERAASAVASHLQSVLTTGNGFLDKLRENLSQAILPQVDNHTTANQSLQMFKSADDLIRRAHGLSDPRQGVDITSGGLPMHQKALSILEACTKLVKDGVRVVDIDVDALQKEMEHEKETDRSIPTRSVNDGGTGS